jgi:hypothetical protein
VRTPRRAHIVITVGMVVVEPIMCEFFFEDHVHYE